MYNIERKTFQRCLVKEGFLYLRKSSRSGWYVCYSYASGYGNLCYQFSFKPDYDSFKSAWDTVIANYEDRNIYFEDN